MPEILQPVLSPWFGRLGGKLSPKETAGRNWGTERTGQRSVATEDVRQRDSWGWSAKRE